MGLLNGMVAREDTPSVSTRTIVVLCAGLAAGWIGAGSVGALLEPMRVALVGLGLTVAVSAARPNRQVWLRLGGLAVATALFAWLLPAGAVFWVLVCAATLAVLATGRADAALAAPGAEGVRWRPPRPEVLLAGACSLVVLALYRLAVTSIGSVWWVTDRLGGLLAAAAGELTARPLDVGATYAGLDMLVLSGTFYALWLRAAPPPRRRAALWGAAAIVGAHALYLGVLAHWHDLRAALPPPPEVTISSPFEPVPWSLSAALASLLPWNLPALAVVLHTGVLAALARFGRWDDRRLAAAAAEGEQPPARTSRGRAPGDFTPPSGKKVALDLGPIVLALAVPLLVAFALPNGDLTGRRVVVYAEGHIDFDRPEHGNYGRRAMGLHGMIPALVASLGGQAVISDALSAEELAEADVVVLIHPVQRWPEDRLERLWEHVRQGGSLLVAGEPERFEDGQESGFNAAVKPTGIRFRRDTVICSDGDWQHSVIPLSHPSTVGLRGAGNHYGFFFPASLEIPFTARPFLVGDRGWSNPGSDALLTAVWALEPGERFGDLVLAAESRLGRGRVVVWGDTSPLTNEGYVSAYTFVARTLAYLADRGSGPHAYWRQALGLAGLVGLAVLLSLALHWGRLLAASATLVVALGVCGTLAEHFGRAVPDGRRGLLKDGGAPHGVAYITATHMEAYNEQNWSDDSISGLTHALMRSGLLPFMMPQLSSERLERAALVIAVAPQRGYTAAERARIRRYVEGGGIFICSVGAEESRPAASLLAEFGLAVPPSPVPARENVREPRPVGRKRVPFYQDDEGDVAYALTYSGWAIETGQGPYSNLLAREVDDQPESIAVSRPVDQGRFILIADSGFAMTKNLETISGDPLMGNRDNAHFWRWLLSDLFERQTWTPPTEPPGDESPGVGLPDEPPAEPMPDVPDLLPLPRLPRPGDLPPPDPEFELAPPDLDADLAPADVEPPPADVAPPPDAEPPRADGEDS